MFCAPSVVKMSEKLASLERSSHSIRQHSQHSPPRNKQRERECEREREREREKEREREWEREKERERERWKEAEAMRKELQTLQQVNTAQQTRHPYPDLKTGAKVGNLYMK